MEARTVRLWRVVPVWLATVLTIAAIGAFDYFSGVELRVYPLYYVPISLLAWYRGRRGALIASALCTLAWLTSNVEAGRQYSLLGIWIANTVVQGVSFAIVGVLIASLRAALMRERALSRIDPLTSLLNSRAFYEEGRRSLALCRRAGRPVTAAYIDLDNFKSVNDTLGHEAGDRLLRIVADHLRTSVRPSDLSARLGGDEFALLLPEVGPQDAAVTLERLRLTLTNAADASPGTVTVSIGGVTFIAVPGDMEEMIQQADSRMYEAKAAGKNRVRLDVAGSA
ncbi:MAG: GGDEF domain-containing protein [Acidobacteriia bacterium]|nr:GGDEF domain-containing protein [Terriglobia bacterium]